MSNKPPKTEPLEAVLTHADDRLLAEHWMRPQAGIVPFVRAGLENLDSRISGVSA
jgi:hypothetical protein